MTSSTVQPASAKANLVAGGPLSTSRALEWLWKHFQDVRQARVLDCGPVCQATLDVLLRRGPKFYVADLVTSALRGDPEFWDRSRKHPVFLLEPFLGQLPNIPSASLSVVFCWHLLDLLPRDPLPAVMDRLCSYLQPGGALFCLLREPFLLTGAETSWWLESLTVLGSGQEGRQPFPYPALTNREVERLAGTCAAKTFLTRSGRREVLITK